MFKKTLIALTFALASLPGVVLASADGVAADPEHYTVEFENDRVRIIRIKYGPGEKSVMHTHGANVSVLLSDGTIRMNLPDGTSEDLQSEVGVAAWSDGDEHLPENLSDKQMEVVLIELKE